MRVARVVAHAHVVTTKPLIGYTTLVVVKGKEVLIHGLRTIDKEADDIRRQRRDIKILHKAIKAEQRQMV